MNDQLRLASMFHSMYAITSELSPVGKSSGIQILDTPTFKLRCFQTPTGVKFYLTAPPKRKQKELATLLTKVYNCYADFVMKNPFYEPEQPIRCERFHEALLALLKP
jgi:trafficking protein particle complex subunit 4